MRTQTFIAAVACAAVLAVAPPARAQSPTDQAEALVREGTELRRQNQDARALPLFERAYKLARNPRTAAQLGLVKMALGYWVDGERLLDEALATPDHPWIARNLQTLEQARATARRNIGEIVVVGAPAGAEVLINGHAVGKLPLSEPIRLDKGPVEVHVGAADHVPFARSLRIAGGARESLSVTLERAPAAAGGGSSAGGGAALALAGPPPVDVTARESPPAASAGSVRLLRPMAWTAGALAAASLAFGIAETVVATNRIDDFNGHTVASPTPTDPDRRVPDCETLQLSDACRSIRDASDRAKTLAIVGYVGAGALAATSAALFVLSRRQPPSPAHVGAGDSALACAPTLSAPGLTCRLVF